MLVSSCILLSSNPFCCETITEHDPRLEEPFDDWLELVDLVSSWLPSKIGLRTLLGGDAKLPLACPTLTCAEAKTSSSEAKAGFPSVGRIVLNGMLGSEDGPMVRENGVEAMRAAAAKFEDVKVVWSWENSARDSSLILVCWQASWYLCWVFGSSLSSSSSYSSFSNGQVGMPTDGWSTPANGLLTGSSLPPLGGLKHKTSQTRFFSCSPEAARFINVASKRRSKNNLWWPSARFRSFA